MDPREAAALVHHFDGYNVGGSRLKVRVELPPNQVLPGPRRTDRKRSRARGKTPWLPYLDDIARISATPHGVAMRHGELLAQTGLPVMDPFCGAGGDAIGAAVAGCKVIASDKSPVRIELAKQNALHFGVGQQIHFSVSDAQVALSSSEAMECCLFVDPPWGGAGWNRETMGLDAWTKQWPWLPKCLSNARAVVLKLPRTFNLESLESTGRQWTFEPGIEDPSDHPADRIRLLTAHSF